MKINIIASTLIVIILTMSAVSILASVGASHTLPTKQSPFPSNAYRNNITIEANGNLNVTGAPISISGNYYNLTGDINGTLMIKHNGTILNGEGYTIFKVNSLTQAVVNVSDANYVRVTNLKINSTAPAFGVYVNNGSHDLLDHLNVSSTFGGIEVANQSSYTNVSDSVVSIQENFAPYESALLLGLYNNLSTGLPSTSSTSPYLSAYNDTLYTNNTYFSLMVGSTKASIFHNSIDSRNVVYLILDASNNSSISGNDLRGSHVAGGIAISPSFGSTPVNNVSVTDNLLNLTFLSSYSLGISYSANGNISGNTILMNATSSGSAMGIQTLKGNATVTGNFIKAFGGGMHGSGAEEGIVALDSNNSISSNVIKLEDQNAYGVELVSSGTVISNTIVTGNNINESGPYGDGILFSGMWMQNSRVSGNDITINSATATGIQVGGSNITVSGNTVNIADSGGSYGISALYGGTTMYNLDISNNYIDVKGPSTTSFLFGMSVQSPSVTLNNLTLNDNTINLEQNASQSTAIYVQSVNDASISGNNAFMNSTLGTKISMTDVTNAKVDGNTFQEINSPVFNGGADLNLAISQNITFSNNTFINSFIGLYSYSSTSIVFYGNSIINTSYYALYFYKDSGVMAYHNNFVNYSREAYNYSSTGIQMNSSYPVGGNYWSSYIGTDANSGPAQNVKGADGIGDTSIALGSNLVDYYPLMKMWNRPHATFHETGLLKGAVWSVTFNGKTKTSSQGTITFYLSNATYQSYSYSISTVKTYNGGGKSGTYSYSHDNYSYSTTFKPYYTVTFSESGLPSGMQWNITVNGTSHAVKTGTFTIVEVNGTAFSYSVSNLSLYYTTTAPGSLTLSGGNRTVDVSFTHYSYISGTVSTQGASVFINGKQVTVTNGTFNATETSGTYSVEITDPGYQTQYDNFSLVAGHTQSLNITLVKINNGGLPGGDGMYIVIGAAIVVAAGVVIYFVRFRPKA